MQSSPFQSVMARLGGLFARPKEIVARVHIEPASHVARADGVELAGAPLTIAVRIANARTDVHVAKEAVHE
jgi:hypothetical protein